MSKKEVKLKQQLLPNSVDSTQQVISNTGNSKSLVSLRSLTPRQRALMEGFDRLMTPLQQSIEELREGCIQVNEGMKRIVDKLRIQHQQRQAHLNSLRQQATQTEPIEGLQDLRAVKAASRNTQHLQGESRSISRSRQKVRQQRRNKTVTKGRKPKKCRSRYPS